MTALLPTALKIAIVEDSAIIVDRLIVLLQDIAGVEFIGTAATLPAAVALLETTLPDALILDINLRTPDGRNGIDLLAMIRNVYPLMKIMMLTNLADLRYRALCQESGADYFFDKSHDFDKITETLHHIIDARNRQRMQYSIIE
ncbi:MAG TPA: response regulator transcription factor [Ohtaekwangia sp.]|nr:response regulator transcription factor [Ohtaekwangia sp.]